MLRKMRQASLEKKEATSGSAAAARQDEVSHFEQNAKTDIENNAIDGLETMAGGTPPPFHFHVTASDEATNPPPRDDDAPRSRDPVESPSWDLQRKISRQIEYYFGDYNLPRDKFMLDLMLEDEGRFRIGALNVCLIVYITLIEPKRSPRMIPTIEPTSRLDLHGQDDYFPATRSYVQRPGRNHGRDRELRQRTTHGGRS